MTRGEEVITLARKPAANKSATKVKPAAKGEKPAAKAKPAVTVQDIAGKVGVTDKSLRVRIRKILNDGNAVVGRGKRYGWDSWEHKEVKQILAAYKG